MFPFKSVFRSWENSNLIVFVQKQWSQPPSEQDIPTVILHHSICRTVSHFFVYVEQMVIIAAMTHEHGGFFYILAARVCCYSWTLE